MDIIFLFDASYMACFIFTRRLNDNVSHCTFDNRPRSVSDVGNDRRHILFFVAAYFISFCLFLYEVGL